MEHESLRIGNVPSCIWDKFLGEKLQKKKKEIIVFIFKHSWQAILSSLKFHPVDSMHEYVKGLRYTLGVLIIGEGQT